MKVPSRRIRNLRDIRVLRVRGMLSALAMLAASAAIAVGPGSAFASQAAPSSPTAPTPVTTPAPEARSAAVAPAVAGGKSRTVTADVSFSLVLLVASNQAAPASGAADSIPPGVAKALADLRDFLPYRSYEFLDAAWIRTSGSTSTTVAAPGGGTYDVRLWIEPVEPNPTRIWIRSFLLREVPGSLKEVLELRAAQGNPGVKDTPLPVTARELLSTSLSLAMGETVVVGTSRLDGSGKALIVLLTARP